MTPARALFRIDPALVAPPRGRWGAPKIDGELYGRPSSTGKILEDGSALTKWQARMAAFGVATSPDLTALAATSGGDKSVLDDVVVRALERARAGSAAAMGTAIHAATELVDRGDPLDLLPEAVRIDALAYRAALDAAGLTPVVAEVFTVNDELRVAGSFDRVVRGPRGGYAVLDLKTGSESAPRYSGLSWGVQLACYATGVPYCADRGRLPWDVVGVDSAPSDTFGIVAHLPQGTGRCDLYRVDLTRGYFSALLAAEVRKARREPYLTAVPAPAGS